MARRSAPSAQPPRLGDIAHVSYSTLTTWFDCPKQVELRKIRRAPAVPAWWFAGGSAVHSATEEYDRWTLLDPVTRPKFSVVDTFAIAFRAEVDEIKSKEPDVTKWRHAGPKTAPETEERWLKNGPLFVGNYIKWRRATDYQVVMVGDEPAIELDVSCVLPGCDREVKAYLDRLFYSPSLDQQHVIDLKTGTRGPRIALQFGVYRACLEQKYDLTPATGAAFMNREGDIGKAFPLDKYTPAYVGKLFGHLSRAIDAGVFPAHQGPSCRMCDVGDACYINGGSSSHLYDLDDPNCPPF